MCPEDPRQRLLPRSSLGSLLHRASRLCRWARPCGCSAVAEVLRRLSGQPETLPRCFLQTLLPSIF